MRGRTSGIHQAAGCLLALAGLLLVAACSADDGAGAPPTSTAPTTTGRPATVAPDLESADYVISVSMTDTGFEPHTVFLPAGHHVRLVLRNRGESEHHYRIVGLSAEDIRWYLYPELSEDELIAMADEPIDDIDHVLHHLTPDFVPFKQASPGGIQPLPLEVHGYATPGGHDVILFYPTSLGSYVVQDVFHPEITGKIVVFDPVG